MIYDIYIYIWHYSGTQLRQCPNSIIILNDIQSMMWEVVLDLQLFFDGIYTQLLYIYTHRAGYLRAIQGLSEVYLRVLIVDTELSFFILNDL